MVVRYEGVAVDDRLDIAALSETSWRVTDTCFPGEGSVLAYVERVDGHVAVSVLYPPPKTDLVVDTFAEAIAVISQRSACTD